METLTEVQQEILRQAINISKQHNITYTGKLRIMLALEGYSADDIKAALQFWGDREVTLSNTLRRP